MFRLVKNLVKWGMVLYPVAKTVMNSKKKKEAYSGGKSRR